MSTAIHGAFPATTDLVLLDDRFATIVDAIEQGRATFADGRRFLTYHLTDNVAELAPFAATLTAFAVVLLAGGSTWGAIPSPGLLATASGTAFAAIVLVRMASAFACRSETRPAHRLHPRRNSLLLQAVIIELAAGDLPRRTLHRRPPGGA